MIFFLGVMMENIMEVMISKSTKEDIAEAYVYNENRTKIQDAFNREKDADKIGMLKIFGAKKKSDQNESREVSKANIRLEVLDPKEEKILESDSRIALYRNLVSGNG